MWGWISTLVSLLVAAVLLYFVLQGVIFVGWAIGGGLVVILLLLLVFEVIDLDWLLWLILAILVINFILDVIF